MEIRKAKHSDIWQMVACHRQAFWRQPMTEMGITWLSDLYRYFLEHPGGVSIVAVDDTGTVVGLAVGGDPGIRSEFISKAVLRRCYLFPVKFITSAVLRKKAIQYLFSKLFKSKNKPVPEDVKNKLEQCGVLLSIGVMEQCQGTQVASKLIQEFFETVVNNYEMVRLSVRADNRRARRFYEKNGWVCVFENKEEAKYIKHKTSESAK